MYKSQFTEERSLKVTKAEAYWISPRGRILPVTDKHINIIVDNPLAFGLTMSQVEAIYAEHDETVGHEGKAREQIIIELVKQGWIRVRNYIRQNKWSVNIGRLNDKNKDMIKYFADEMMKIGYSPYEELIIDSPTFRKKFTMGDLANDALYLEEKKKPSKSRYGVKGVTKYIEKEMKKPYIKIR